LKEAAEEIKTLRNVAGLIKHDVLSQQEKKEATHQGFSSRANLNPFLENDTMPNSHRTSTRELTTMHLQ
jgi:hypothetical protein